MEMSQQMARKVGEVIGRSVAALDASDRDARIEWCQRTGVHGVRMLPEGEWVTFVWGGGTLASIERALLLDDSAELPAPEFVEAVPDDARGLLDDLS